MDEAAGEVGAVYLGLGRDERVGPESVCERLEDGLEAAADKDYPVPPLAVLVQLPKRLGVQPAVPVTRYVPLSPSSSSAKHRRAHNPAYNLGNFFRRLGLPKAVKHWSLRSVQVKLIKMGGRLVRHSRRFIVQLAEVSVPRWLFEGVLDRIGRLSSVPS